MKHVHGATIRAYSPTDCDRLADIWLEASRVGHPFLSEADLLDQQVKVRNIYLPQAENWVVELDGKPASPGQRPYSAAGSILPGFMMSSGSSACLIARIT